MNLTEKEYNVKDVKDVQFIEINDKYIYGTRVELKILDIYKGKKYQDTCVSEINFYGEAFNKKTYSKDNLNKCNIKKIKELFFSLKEKEYSLVVGALCDSELNFSENNVEFVFAYAAEGPYYYVYALKYSLTDNGYIYFYPNTYYFYADTIKGDVPELKSKPKPIDFKSPLDITIAKIDIEKNKLRLSLKQVNYVFREMFFELINSGTVFIGEADNKILKDLLNMQIEYTIN